MKFGVTTYLWSADFTPEHLSLLPSIKDAGFDGVEIPIFHPQAFAAADIRRGLAASGLECVVSSVLVDGLSLASDDNALRRRSIAHVTEVVKAAAEVGARVVAGPIYTPVGFTPGRRSNDDWSRRSASISEFKMTTMSYFA